ncbi:MAG: hypothetical protein ABUL62_34300 [Myxococcales bacterium]
MLPSLMLAALLGFAAALAPTRALADDEIPSKQAGMYGEPMALVDIVGMTASGTRRGSGDVDYTRKAGLAEFRIGGFFDEDYFKTLIGLELQVALGYQGSNSYGAAPPPAVVPVAGTPAPTAPYVDPTSGFYMRGDVAFTYGLVRWNRVIPGRVVMGAGGGFEAGPRLRGGEGGQGYALLFGRLQLWPSESLGLHLTAATTVGTYRLEALGSIDNFTVGARARFISPARDDLTQETQLEALAGYLF